MYNGQDVATKSVTSAEENLQEGQRCHLQILTDQPPKMCEASLKNLETMQNAKIRSFRRKNVMMQHFLLQKSLNMHPRLKFGKFVETNINLATSSLFHLFLVFILVYPFLFYPITGRALLPNLKIWTFGSCVDLLSKIALISIGRSLDSGALECTGQ